MKVLVDTFTLTQSTTGIRTYTIELTEGLMDLGGKVRLIAPFYQTFKMRRSQRSTRLFSKIWHHTSFFFWKQVILPILCLAHRPQVLICTDYILPFLASVSCKLVVFHDAFFWENKSHYNELWRKYFTQMALVGLRGNAIILATSNYTKLRLEQSVPSLKNIEVVYQSPRRTYLPKTEIREQKYFLHVGSLEKRKNLPVLVRAYSIFCKRNPNLNVPLILAGGNGPGEDMNDRFSIEKIIRDENLEGKVKLTGYVDDKTVEELYNGALAFIFPSYDEGFGIPIIEAMERGLPVIVSDRGASSEISGGAALVFPHDDPSSLSDQLIELMNESKRKELQGRGLKRAKDFSRKKFSSDVLSVIENFER